MQNTAHLLMIQPVNFGYNTETEGTNSFQKKGYEHVQQMALQEFNAFVDLLRNNKLDVTVVEDSHTPFTPDSVFPNNWISFHDDGRIFLYPMFAVNRRAERKDAVMDAIKAKFSCTEIINLSEWETKGLYLEGTGSMVLDRENKMAYASLSPRTDEKILKTFCELANYSPVIFRSADSTGMAIYHTNVMMCIADAYAVICLDAIADLDERRLVISYLQKTKKRIIAITLQQLNCFAGNMLQIKNADGDLLLVMSDQAYQSLTSEQTNVLEKYNRIIHTSLLTIETVGGGSARCMLAEIFVKD